MVGVATNTRRLGVSRSYRSPEAQGWDRVQNLNAWGMKVRGPGNRKKASYGERQEQGRKSWGLCVSPSA